MPIEAVKIPQNVYVEERIVGPITLRQIIITMIGAGISYALWSTFSAAGGTSIVSMIIAGIPALIAVAFAFVKINDISLFRLMILFMEKMEHPTIRTWQPRTGISINIFTKPTAEKKVETKVVKEKQPGIEELSALLDAEAEIVEKEIPATEAPAAVVVSQKTLPVNKERVSASPLSQSIDEKIIRDLSPPVS